MIVENMQEVILSYLTSEDVDGGLPLSEDAAKAFLSRYEEQIRAFATEMLEAYTANGELEDLNEPYTDWFWEFFPTDFIDALDAARNEENQ